MRFQPPDPTLERPYRLQRPVDPNLQNHYSSIMSRATKRHHQARGCRRARPAPIAEIEMPPGFIPDESWEELTRLDQLIAEGWPAGITSADILSEMRR